MPMKNKLFMGCFGRQWNEKGTRVFGKGFFIRLVFATTKRFGYKCNPGLDSDSLLISICWFGPLFYG